MFFSLNLCLFVVFVSFIYLFLSLYFFLCITVLYVAAYVPNANKDIITVQDDSIHGYPITNQSNFYTIRQTSHVRSFFSQRAINARLGGRLSAQLRVIDE